jgi:hypothetical protein
MGISADIYTAERASFRERVAALVGRSTWREPMEGHSTAPLKMTDQDVAAALAYARQGPDDIGPDMAYCIICGSDWHRARIIKGLATALFHSGGHWLRRGRPYLLTIADDAFCALVHQRRIVRPEGCPPRTYDALLLVALSTLQNVAEESLHRAERAFRSQAA